MKQRLYSILFLVGLLLNYQHLSNKNINTCAVIHKNFHYVAISEFCHFIVNRARWFGNSLELQYKSLSMFLFWFMQE